MVEGKSDWVPDHSNKKSAEIQSVKYKIAQMWNNLNTGVLMYKGAQVEGCSSTEVLKWWIAVVQRLWSANVLKYKSTEIKSAEMQGCWNAKYLNPKVLKCRSTKVQMCQNAKVLKCRGVKMYFLCVLFLKYSYFMFWFFAQVCFIHINILCIPFVFSKMFPTQNLHKFEWAIQGNSVCMDCIGSRKVFGFFAQICFIHIHFFMLPFLRYSWFMFWLFAQICFVHVNTFCVPFPRIFWVLCAHLLHP